MAGPEAKKRVKVQNVPGKGVNVYIGRKQLEKMGIDPDATDIEVSRYIYDSDRAECRLRFYD